MLALSEIRGVVAEQDLTDRSSWRAIGRTLVVGSLYAALAVAGFLADRAPVWAAVWLVQSFILVGAYSAMHEGGHSTLYSSRRANHVAGVLWGSTILVNWSLWRAFHLEHHAHTAEPGDPESKYKVAIVRRSQYLLMPLGGLQFIGDLWVASLRTLTGRFPAYVRTRHRRRTIQLEAVFLLLVTAALVSGAIAAPGLVIHVWLAPLLVMVCLTMPATALNEHYGCATSGDALQTTRTVVSNRALRYLLWNGNYHAGHHLMPSVPFHHAPALHRLIEPQADYVARSYTAFHLEVLRGCGRRA